MLAMPRFCMQRHVASGGSEERASKPASPEKSPLEAAGAGCGVVAERKHICGSKGSLSPMAVSLPWVPWARRG